MTVEMVSQWKPENTSDIDSDRCIADPVGNDYIIHQNIDRAAFHETGIKYTVSASQSGVDCDFFVSHLFYHAAGI